MSQTTFTTLKLLSKGGLFHHNGVVSVLKGHTRNWYRHIGNNLWINYNCTSEGF